MQIPPILENLKHLLKIDLNISNLISLHINCNNNCTTEKYYIIESDRALAINYPQLSVEEKNCFDTFIKNSQEIGIPILEKNARNITEDIYLKEESKEESEILDFYIGKISVDDFTALRASLYLRSRFRERASRLEIDNLKMGIIQQYGKRGGNISDLCSAGYFEAMMDLSKTANLQNFSKLYEAIVGKGALTIFVSERNSPIQLIQQISKRINTDRKYGGEGIIQIHGMGKRNIETIKIAMETIESTFFNLIVNTSLESGVMVVSIKF